MAHDSSGKDNTPEVAISIEAFFFADRFAELVGVTIDPPSRRSWAKCYDELIRLDKRTPEQITAVCEWGHRDSFWSPNFLSPLRLRRKNEDGVKYFDAFAAKLRAANTPKPNGKPAKPSGLEGIRMVS